jgi:hypothetical protein
MISRSIVSLVGRIGSEHVICRHSLPNALQLELACWFDRDGILHRDQHALADEDLPRLGLVAESRCNV